MKLGRAMSYVAVVAGSLSMIGLVGCSAPAAPTPLHGATDSVQQAAVPASLPTSAEQTMAVPSQSVVPTGVLIVQTGNKYVGSAIPERTNCKEFARRVVREASGGRVTLPSTAGNEYEWYLPSTGVQLFATIKPSSPRPIYGVDTGDIIQMVSRKHGLHTAIVKSNTGSGMVFVEANRFPTGTVSNTRFQSFADFLSEMSGWTVYRIAW